MRLKAGIVGVGNIGSIHYRIYKQIKEIEKIYLADTNTEALKAFEEERTRDYEKLLGKVDLVSIAVPTCSHYRIARFFLRHNVPVLVEKPLASSVKHARELLSLSKKTHTLLFAGHVERYNAAYRAVKKLIRAPSFIECHRLSLYPHDTKVDSQNL